MVDGDPSVKSATARGRVDRRNTSGRGPSGPNQRTALSGAGQRVQLLQQLPADIGLCSVACRAACAATSYTCASLSRVPTAGSATSCARAARVTSHAGSCPVPDGCGAGPVPIPLGDAPEAAPLPAAAGCTIAVVRCRVGLVAQPVSMSARYRPRRWPAAGNAARRRRGEGICPLHLVADPWTRSPAVARRFSCRLGHLLRLTAAARRRSPSRSVVRGRHDPERSPRPGRPCLPGC